MSFPGVDVVIPVFNRIELLRYTLQSLFNQSYKMWRLLIVDDGSQEDVRSVIIPFNDLRICVIRQMNQGNAIARNTGIYQGLNKYVICLDSDDVWHPEMLYTTVTFLETHPEVDVVYTQVQSIDDKGKPLPRPIGPQPREGDLLEPLLMGMPILPSSVLARRRCFEQWGAYTPGLDDWELWLRWAARGCRFACIEQPLLYYRIHSQNFNLDWERRRETHFRMLDAFFALDNLPEVAYRLRERAYANQHFYFAILAGQVDRLEDALSEFTSAVLRHPLYLDDLDFYTRIACVHQGRIDAGTERGLDLRLAETTVLQALAGLFKASDLPAGLKTRRGRAYAMAYLALARLAYGVVHEMRLARHYLWQAWRCYPALTWRTDWVLWLARAAIGYNTLQRIKHILRFGVEYAHS
ncbi:MAG: glycosyltransferase family 2 protein [Serratia sp.]|nr:glycosyltransferase family 2 protein [Serratia sp. (in: enterobacteria)]